MCDPCRISTFEISADPKMSNLCRISTFLWIPKCRISTFLDPQKCRMSNSTQVRHLGKIKCRTSKFDINSTFGVAEMWTSKIYINSTFGETKQMSNVEFRQLVFRTVSQNVTFDGVSVLKANLYVYRIHQCVLVDARYDDILDTHFQGHTGVTKVIECKVKFIRWL